jgi:hypothetical protein
MCDSGDVEVIIEGAVKEAYLAIVAKERGAETLREKRLAVGIDERALSEAERAIGHSIPRELLLMFGDSDVFGLYDLDLSKVAERQGDAAQAGAPPTLVALGRDGTEWICFDRREREARVAVYDQDDQSVDTQTLADWLGHVMETHLHGEEPSEDEERAVTTWCKATPLKILTVAEPPFAQYRVRHSKFGEGMVVREDASSSDPKLEVDFGSVGKKTLLARYVERI